MDINYYSNFESYSGIKLLRIKGLRKIKKYYCRHMVEYGNKSEFSDAGYLSSRNTEYEFYRIIDEQDNKDVGFIVLYDIDNINKNACAGGAIFDSDMAEQYFSRAMITLIKIAFLKRGLYKVYIKTLENDERLCQFWYKFEFRTENFLRRHVYRNGEFQNLRIFSLLVNEYFHMHYKSFNADVICERFDRQQEENNE